MSVTTMMRVKDDSHALAQEIAGAEGMSLQNVVAAAMEDYYRRWLIDGTNSGYRDLRADQDTWRKELAERRLWDTTLIDGVDAEQREPTLAR